MGFAILSYLYSLKLDVFELYAGGFFDLLNYFKITSIHRQINTYRCFLLLYTVDKEQKSDFSALPNKYSKYYSIINNTVHIFTTIIFSLITDLTSILTCHLPI